MEETPTCVSTTTTLLQIQSMMTLAAALEFKSVRIALHCIGIHTQVVRIFSNYSTGTCITPYDRTVHVERTISYPNTIQFIRRSLDHGIELQTVHTRKTNKR